MPGPHKRYARYREVIQALNEAVLGRRRVRMSYRTGSTGRVATRRLDPYRVWYRSGGLYVIGHDHKSGEVRTFAVDRIGSAALEEERFRIPASFDFDAYTASAFGVVAEPATRVRIRFDARLALQIEERVWHPSQKLERLPGGALELVLEVGGLAEVQSWVLSFGAGAEVLEPPELRAAVEGELAVALDRYRPPPRTGGAGPEPRGSGRHGFGWGTRSRMPDSIGPPALTSCFRAPSASAAALSASAFDSFSRPLVNSFCAFRCVLPGARDATFSSASPSFVSARSKEAAAAGKSGLAPSRARNAARPARSAALASVVIARSRVSMPGSGAERGTTGGRSPPRCPCGWSWHRRKP